MNVNVHVKTPGMKAFEMRVSVQDSDTIEKVVERRNHDAKAAQIAKAGQDFAYHNLTFPGLECYISDALHFMAEVIEAPVPLSELQSKYGFTPVPEPNDHLQTAPDPGEILKAVEAEAITNLIRTDASVEHSHKSGHHHRFPMTLQDLVQLPEEEGTFSACRNGGSVSGQTCAQRSTSDNVMKECLCTRAETQTQEATCCHFEQSLLQTRHKPRSD